MILITLVEIMVSFNSVVWNNKIPVEIVKKELVSNYR